MHACHGGGYLQQHPALHQPLLHPSVAQGPTQVVFRQTIQLTCKQLHPAGALRQWDPTGFLDLITGEDSREVVVYEVVRM